MSLYRTTVLYFALSALSLLVSNSHAWSFLQQPTRAPPKDVRILILPGFGNDQSDYFLEQAPQGSLVQSLQKRGWETVEVLEMKRSDWLQVFTRGALDLEFWKGTAAPTRPAFSWYLDRVCGAIDKSDCDVVIVAHSAGGWLARAALGYSEDTRKKVLGLVTLGAPHLPPPPEVMDMTRGALRITDEKFPGSFHLDELFYLTVIGKAVKGQKQVRQSPLEPQTVSGFAYNSYEAVCGDGTAEGDGVVPLQSAHLEAAKQLTLEGILHSINAPDQWYGSDSQIDLWHKPLLQELERARIANRKKKAIQSLV